VRVSRPSKSLCGNRRPGVEGLVGVGAVVHSDGTIHSHERLFT
jgi:hypothetical protein